MSWTNTSVACRGWPFGVSASLSGPGVLGGEFERRVLGVVEMT
jgi:hypothetical protein